MSGFLSSPAAEAPRLRGIDAADVGLLGELRISSGATRARGWFDADSVQYSRSPDYYEPMAFDELLADAWRWRDELTRAQCRAGSCRALTRYRAADYLLNRSVRLTDSSFAGTLDPVLRQFINAAARVIVRQLRQGTHDPVVAAAPLPEALSDRPVPLSRDQARPRTIVEGDNHFMTLTACSNILRRNSRPPARHDVVIGPLLGAGAVVPLWAHVIGIPWDYCKISLYDDSTRRSVMPALPTGLSALVVDDNAGSGRTLAAIADALDRRGCRTEPRCVELHYEKFRRDPDGSLFSIADLAPGLLHRAPLWAYRHHTTTSDFVARHRSGTPGSPSTAHWWKISSSLRAGYAHEPSRPTGSSPVRAASIRFPEQWERACPMAASG